MMHVVIMAGGSGTRFWPASRRQRPKQFLALASESSLLRQTYERIGELAPAERVWVVTTESTAEMTRELLPELPPTNILAEPVGRDTAACAGFAAQVVLHCDPQAVCVLMPADHVIGEQEDFRRAVAGGAAHVLEAGGLLTFGVRPTRAETGYGYLKIGTHETTVGGVPVHRLARFVEKPDAATAREYLDGGEYLWNSGIFAWRADELLSEIERQLPRLASGLSQIGGALGTAEEAVSLAEVYPTLQRISLDFGVMEGARRCWTVPVSFPWSDVGSWSALPDVLASDADGNACRGRVLTMDCQDNLIVSEGPVVAAMGVRDLIVVATPEGVLVLPAERAQEVKSIVGELVKRGWDDVL